MKEMNNKRTYILSAVLPMIFTAIVMMFFMYPFADRCVFASDLKDQYINSIAEMVYKIKHGESIFNTYKTAFGTDFSGVVLGYLDLINLIFFVVPIKYYHFAYIITYIIRIGLCGLFTSVFFVRSRIIDLSGRWITAFSCMYALCMFNVECSINFFYLIMSSLMPLCLLAVEHFYETRKIAPFIVLYAINVYYSWYMAYMVGICCFIYFVYYSAVCGKSLKQAASALGLMIASAAFAIMLGMVVILPGFRVLSENYTETFSDLGTKFVQYSIPEVCRTLFFVADGPMSYTQFPAVYSGVLPQFLSLALILSPAASKKERAAAACISVFYFASLLFRPLYLAMHFFRAPAGADCRYAFAMALMYMIFSARFVTLGFKNDKKTKLVPLAAVLLALAISMSHFMNGYYLVCGIAAAALAFIYTYVLVSEKRKNILVFFAAAEAFMCMAAGIFISVKYMGYPEYTQYEKQFDNTKKAVEITDKAEKGFYRAADVCNSNLLFQLSAGYNSLSTFYSGTNRYASDFARAMGVRSVTDGRSIYNSDNSIVSESIFNVKYVYATDKSTLFEDDNGRKMYVPNGARLNNDMYEKIYTDEDIDVYKNKFAFPLMFEADPEVLHIAEKFGGGPGDSFDDTQMFLNSVCKMDEKLYEEIEVSVPEFKHCHFEKTQGGEDMIILDDLRPGTVSAQTRDETGIVKYETKIEEDGVYIADIYFSNGERNPGIPYVVMVNGQYLDFDFQKNDTIRDLGHLKKGDTVSVEVTALVNGVVCRPVKLFKLNTEAFAKISAKVNANSPKNIVDDGGVIRAETDRKTAGLIFTTIAYSEGFDVYIDGKKADKTSAFGTFLCFEVPSGKHDIAIKYVTPGIISGGCISLCTLIILLICFYMRKIQKKKGEV